MLNVKYEQLSQDQQLPATARYNALTALDTINKGTDCTGSDKLPSVCIHIHKYVINSTYFIQIYRERICINLNPLVETEVVAVETFFCWRNSFNEIVMFFVLPIC